MKRTVKLPNGKTLTVNAPDDAEDDDVINFVRAKLDRDEREKDRQLLVDMIDSQNKEINNLREELVDFSKSILKLTDRIQLIADRELPAPVINVTPSMKMPEIKVMPAAVEQSKPAIVNVTTDPAITLAITEMRKTLEKTVKAPEKNNKNMTFEIEHDMDRHSPRFGRIKRVTAVSE